VLLPAGTKAARCGQSSARRISRVIVDGERCSVWAMPRAEQPCCSMIMMVARSSALKCW